MVNITDTSPVLFGKQTHIFLIVFCVGAVLVGTIAAVFFLCVLPRLRRRWGNQNATDAHLEEAGIPMRSSLDFGRTQPERQSHAAIPTTQPQFPSHPAVPRSLRSQPSFPVRTYDPHTETPFPVAPGRESSINTNRSRPQTASGLEREEVGSNGLFSPKKKGNERSRSLSLAGRYQPGDSMLLVRPPSPLDYMLPLPEPMVLQARQAGRPPGLAKQLERFPYPGPFPRNSSRSRSRSTRVKATNEVGVQELSNGTQGSVMDNQLPLPDFKDMAGSAGSGNLRKSTSIIPQSPDECTKLDAHFLQKRAVKRSHWRSFASPRLPNTKISRKGTVTRPKTPVVEIRTRFDSQQTKSIAIATSSGIDSDSQVTEPATFSSETQQTSNSTTATSPFSQLKNLPRIPTPLRLRRAGLRPTAASPTPDPVHDTCTANSMIIPSPEKLAPIVSDQDTGTMPRGKPTMLRLSVSHANKTTKHESGRNSRSSLGSILTPLLAFMDRQRSFQASSVYSRDTKGVTIVPTPLTDTFPSTVESSQGCQSEERNIHLHRKISSADMLRLKIDHWDLPIVDLNDVLPFANVTRSMSDAGPYSPTMPFGTEKESKVKNADTSPLKPLGMGLEVPKPPRICIARSSDDIFSDRRSDYGPERGRVLKRVLDMELASSPFDMQYVFGRTLYGRGTAPGGADWI